MNKTNKKISKLWQITSAVIYLSFIVFALISLSSKLSIGGTRFYSVASGSMMPTLKVGSMAVVRTSQNYSVGDIITFTSERYDNRTITHRIIGVEEKEVIRYITKGDANNAPDAESTPYYRVIGKVIVNIPFIGYINQFTRTLPGLIILIIIPSLLIIIDEYKQIKAEWKNFRKRGAFKVKVESRKIVGQEIIGIRQEAK